MEKDAAIKFLSPYFEQRRVAGNRRDGITIITMSLLTKGCQELLDLREAIKACGGNDTILNTNASVKTSWSEELAENMERRGFRFNPKGKNSWAYEI